MRVGNDASRQFQLDVYGEVLDLLHQASREGLPHEAAAWDMELRIMDVLESAWREPDEGIWEVRGGRQHFVHSKVMAWVGVDRAIRDVELFGFDGPIDRWRALRDEIHAEVCREGFDDGLGAFTQSYGSRVARRGLADDAPRRLPAGDRSPCRRHDRGDPRPADERWVRAPLRHAHGGRRPAGRRGRVRAVHVLAGRLSRAAGTRRRGAGAVRTRAERAQRRRPALRGVRHRPRSPGRQLPAGLLARVPDRHGAEPLARRGRPGRAAPVPPRAGAPGRGSAAGRR